MKTAQTRLGHSEAKLTLDVYAQAVATQGETAAEATCARFPGSSSHDRRAMESNGHAVGLTETRRGPADLVL